MKPALDTNAITMIEISTPTRLTRYMIDIIRTTVLVPSRDSTVSITKMPAAMPNTHPSVETRAPQATQDGLPVTVPMMVRTGPAPALAPSTAQKPAAIHAAMNAATLPASPRPGFDS